MVVVLLVRCVVICRALATFASVSSASPPLRSRCSGSPGLCASPLRLRVDTLLAVHYGGRSCIGDCAYVDTVVEGMWFLPLMLHTLRHIRGPGSLFALSSAPGRGMSGIKGM